MLIKMVSLLLAGDPGANLLVGGPKTNLLCPVLDCPPS